MKASQWTTAARRLSSAAEHWPTVLRGRGVLVTEDAAPGCWTGGRAFRMDVTWLTDRIAVGGGIWNAENMAAVARAGMTHIIDMQIEFDDTELALPHEIEVLWNPVDDDFQPKPPEIFERGVNFAREALDDDGSKLLIHCAAGVHRAPMMALAVLCSMGWKIGEAMQLIGTRRPAADFAEVYVRSVERFLEQQLAAERPAGW
jgi:protein-tyrosine phosphatase